MKAIDLRPGYGVKIDGKLAVVVGYEFRNPGNLRSFVNIKTRDVQGGRTVERRFNPADDIEVINLEQREMEYLYSDSSGATFMDTATFDQIVVNEDILGDALKFLTPNSKCNIMTYEGNPVVLDLPASVELIITDCPPEVKGATVTNQTKDAVTETGLVVKVPGFIKQGEKIRVSTADGAYQSRA